MKGDTKSNKNLKNVLLTVQEVLNWPGDLIELLVEYTQRQICFLDITGVLAYTFTDLSLPAVYDEYNRLMAMRPTKNLGHSEATKAIATIGLRKEAVMNLDRLLLRFPNLELVLSSSMRSNIWNLEELKDVFSTHTFSERFIGCIPDNHHNKWNDIIVWLEQEAENGREVVLKNCIIIDDEAIKLYNFSSEEIKKHLEELRSQHVQPDPDRLLSSSDVDKAIRLLSS
jgi:hypothetical protein